MLVLPAHQSVLLEVLDPFKRSRLRRLEKHPANVRVEKALRDVVRVILVIDELMVPPMVRRPAQDGILKGGSAKKQGHQPHRPPGAESQMGEQPVIAEGDAQTGRDEEKEKQGNLEPMQAKVPNIGRYRRQREEQRANQEDAVWPFHRFPAKTQHRMTASGVGAKQLAKVRPGSTGSHPANNFVN